MTVSYASANRQCDVFLVLTWLSSSCSGPSMMATAWEWRCSTDSAASRDDSPAPGADSPGSSSSNAPGLAANALHFNTCATDPSPLRLLPCLQTGMKRGCVILAKETKARLQAWGNLIPWQQHQGTSSVKLRKSLGSTTIYASQWSSACCRRSLLLAARRNPAMYDTNGGDEIIDSKSHL